MKDHELPVPKLPTPWHLFVALAVVISITETLVHLYLPLVVPDSQNHLQGVVDAFLLICISSPFVWALIARPMRSTAISEFERTKTVMSSIVEAVICFDKDGVIESLNPAAEKMFGYHPREIVGRTVDHIIPGLGADRGTWPESDALLESHETFGRQRGGTIFPVEVSVSNLQMGGQPKSIAIIHDITKRRQVQTLVEEQKRFVENLVLNSAVPTFVINAEHRVLIWNRACEELTGVKAEEMLGGVEAWRAFYDEQHPLLADMVIDGSNAPNHRHFNTFNRSSLIPEGLEAEGWFQNLNGRDRYILFSSAPIRDGNDKLVAVIETLEDITERKRYEEQLEHQANFDGLTGLPNRNLLDDRIHQAFRLARRNEHQVAVFFVDVDHFKLINDSLGHRTGDTLLKVVAERLVGCVRSGDTVARQGGDEFVIIISGVQDISDIGHIAAKILEAVSGPIKINENELVVTCSIGISIFPKDGDDAQTLMKNADVAMYRAKELGRNTYQFFTGEMNARILLRLTMEKHLRRALERDELLLFYQPKVSLWTGQVTGMEALIRWQSPELGFVGPGEFIPLAEETGLIEQIGEWVIRTACEQNKAWQDDGLPPLTVAVNISPRQFRQKDVSGVVSRILHETGLEARYLELEITEGLVMQDVGRATTILNELKRLGVCLAMDDFGTGYSSLSYLKRFPFDKLKVDQSFVRDITSDPDSAAIARTVITMAQSLRLKVIAEGVETESQLNYLRSLACDEMQGYFFSRPIPGAEFKAMLLSRRQLQFPPLPDRMPERSLLVVDDEHHVTSALKRMLQLEGYNVIAAGSAEEGFELLANTRVSVIVSDQQMPGMNGHEFLGRVKELYPDTVRIMLTAYGDFETVSNAVNNGAIYKFLKKPWDDAALLETIADAFKYADR